MKRELEIGEAMDVDAVLFFAQGRDLLRQLVWDDTQTLSAGERRRDVVRTLRSLLTASRALNRTLVLQPALWEALLKEALPSLSTGALDAMHAGDLMRLSAQSGEVLAGAMHAAIDWDAVTQDAGVVAAMTVRTPLEFANDVFLYAQILLDTLWRMRRGTRGVLLAPLIRNLTDHLWSAPDPIGRLLRLVLLTRRQQWAPDTRITLTQPVWRPLRDAVESAYSNYPHFGRMIAPGALVALLALWPRLAERANQQLAQLLRRDTVVLAERLQEPDGALTLVPKAELPRSYVLFWYALTGDNEGADAHQMFHACVTCDRALLGECCWERTAPTVLYCDATCYANK